MGNELALTYDFSAIERAELADSTKEKYRKAIMAYLATGNTLSDPGALSDYAATLPTSGRSFLKAAVRLMSAGLANAMKGNATAENINQVQAALYRLDALGSAIKVKAPKGTKAHTWLSQAEVKRIMAACGKDLEGTRDWIVLGLLVGAGLRREELVTLTFDALKQQPMKGGKMRDVLEVKGKGAKTRVIPIKHVLAQTLRYWRLSAGGSGLVARSLGRKKELGESLSAVAVFHIVRKYGEIIGRPDLDPHDLRRTYAQLGYEAGIPITQISKLLGHANVATTQRYLNLDLDLETTVSDFIPLE